MLAAHLSVHVVVSANGVIADVGGVVGDDEIEAEIMSDLRRALVERRVGMVVADAALGDEIAVVLELVEVIVGDDAVDFFFEVAVGGRNSEVYGFAFEFFGLPVGPSLFLSSATSSQSRSRSKRRSFTQDAGRASFDSAKRCLKNRFTTGSFSYSQPRLSESTAI
jgi:hypothetical protein